MTAVIARPTRRSSRRRTVTIAWLVALLVVAVATPAAAQPDTEEPARVRLAHLSPDTPEVDVYLTGFDGTETLALSGVGYGMASDYLELAPGFYTFGMRPAGAPADDGVVLSLSVEVEAGQAYTLAALGSRDDLQETVLRDDLEAPANGQVSIRLIQAASSVPTVDVVAVDGPVVATDAEFATATGYAEVPAGPWQLEVTAAGESEPVATASPDLAAGSITSLVLLDSPDGGVELRSLVDAAGVPVTDVAGAQVRPRGGVETGMAPAESTSPAATFAFWAAVAVALSAVAGLVAVRARRRAR